MAPINAYLCRTKVWACLGASTLLFIGVSSVFSYIQHKRNPTRNRPHRRTTVFYMLKQIEYVATIFTFQGSTITTFGYLEIIVALDDVTQETMFATLPLRCRFDLV